MVFGKIYEPCKPDVMNDHQTVSTLRNLHDSNHLETTLSMNLFYDQTAAVWQKVENQAPTVKHLRQT